VPEQQERSVMRLEGLRQPVGRERNNAKDVLRVGLRRPPRVGWSKVCASLLFDVSLMLLERCVELGC
jgi:hypothetical protein